MPQASAKAGSIRSRQKGAPARGAEGKPRIGLALAGGGPLGAIYEIGALCALEESIEGLDFTRCDGYIGVSAGGFIAAGLVNGMTPRHLCATVIENSAASADSFDPAILLHPAWSEFRSRLSMLPGLLASAAWKSLVGGRSVVSAMERLGRALPTGMLSSAAMGEQLREQFSLPGRSDDFRQLRSHLYLVATDLDSGEAVPFGTPGWDHIPISQAVRASAALPGLFPPVEIEGRHYVDGALKKTVHASLLLREGVDLLFCLNPLVPYEALAADEPQDPLLPRSGRKPRIARVVDGGLPVIMSQTLRSLIHSRLELGMKGYERSHPGVDILLFEPDHRDAEMFFANPFSYSHRRQLAEHAYQVTRAALRQRATTIERQLARHGLHLRRSLLRDPKRQLLGPIQPPSRTARAMQTLDAALHELEARLEQTPAA